MDIRWAITQTLNGKFVRRSSWPTRFNVYIRDDQMCVTLRGKFSELCHYSPSILDIVAEDWEESEPGALEKYTDEEQVSC